MNQIPTAEEFLISPKCREIRDRLNKVAFIKADAQCMIEFAKLHIEEFQKSELSFTDYLKTIK